MDQIKHIPVLKQQVIDNLNIRKGCVYVDCTAGRGGHISAMLEVCSDIFVIGIDKDEQNTQYLNQKFKGQNVKIVNTDYKNLDDIIKFFEYTKVDGFLFDLGFSSIHVDDPQRGFSFKHDGPLDMRYNLAQQLDAEYVINNYESYELLKIINQYGEESFAKNIVKVIIAERQKQKITSTYQLRNIIHKALPSKYKQLSKIDPATKTFQAIRIEVNNELASLQTGLEKSIQHLNIDGKICAISFHSLEDRIVKNIFKAHLNPCTCPQGLVQCVCQKKPDIFLPIKKVLIADEAEVQLNPRARSAKLRIAQKI